MTIKLNVGWGAQGVGVENGAGGFANGRHRFMFGEGRKDANAHCFALCERQEMEEADGAIVVRRSLRILFVRTTRLMPARIVAVKRFHHEDGQQRGQQQRCDDGSSFRTCYHNLPTKVEGAK